MRKRAQKKRTPAWDDRPELDIENSVVFRLFWLLSESRQIGMDHSPIAMTDLKSGLELFGVTIQEEREEMLHLIKRMDAEYMSWRADAREDRKPNANPPRSNRRPRSPDRR